MKFVLGREENTVEKGESTGHQCFQKVWEKEKILVFSPIHFQKAFLTGLLKFWIVW